MKKKLFKFAVLLVTIVFSCEKEPLDNGVEPIKHIDNEQEFREPFEVVFDQTRYIATNVEAFVASGGISLNAQNSNIGTFLLSIQGVEQRTYASNELTMLYVSPSGETYSATTEVNNETTLTITEINYQNRRISGTFSFIGKKLVNGTPTQETKTFSDGKFYNVTTYGGLTQP